MEIKTQLIPLGMKRRSGKKIKKVEFFVDHDTGNANSTAQNNVDYYIRSANEMSASAHAFVDDKGVIVCVPCLNDAEKAWHVQYDKPNDNKLFGYNSNDVAIGMELCYFPDNKVRTLKAYENYIEFAALLAGYHKVDPSKRAGHFELDPQRRTDPNNALKYIGKTYTDMKSDIITKYNEIYLKKENPKMELKEQTVSPWALDAQAWVKEMKISDGERPKDHVTREELWTMIFRATMLK